MTPKIMNFNIDEKVWVIQMSSLLNDDDEVDIKNHVCIFQVPKAIRNTKPAAYTPQVVALGPYHHFRPKTYYMQRCKLSAALKARQELKLREIPEMLIAIKDRLFDIRASYHDSLSLENETLAWLMLIDGLFLMSLIEKKQNRHQAEQDDQLEDIRGRKHSLNTILKDVVLLENQIPKIVLDAVLLENQVRKLVLDPLRVWGSENDEIDSDDDEIDDSVDLNRGFYNLERLRRKLLHFCTYLSPIELKGNSTHRDMKDPHHVLDFLHQLVWLGKTTISSSLLKSAMYSTSNKIAKSEFKIWKTLESLLSNIKYGPLSVILAMVDLTLKVLDALGISIPRDIFLEKEVQIPSASELTGVGVKFCGIERRGGGVREIAFKHQTESSSGSLSLPVLSYNITSDLMEAVMRNLLVYEAEAMPESSRLGRYVELMSGLMQTTADVDLLKKANTNFHIVPQDANSLKVVELFIRLKEVVGSKGDSELDGTIREVKSYYDNCRKVKIRRLAKRYLFVSWKVLNGIALVLVLTLLLLQTACSIYSCPKIFKSQYLGHLAL